MLQTHGADTVTLHGVQLRAEIVIHVLAPMQLPLSSRHKTGGLSVSFGNEAARSEEMKKSV